MVGTSSAGNQPPGAYPWRFFFFPERSSLMPWYQSRKLWLFVADFVFGLATLLISIQAPQYADVAKMIFGYLQPLIVALIVAITVDDTIKAYFAYKAAYAGKMK
jgi:hypothetical protein